MKIAIFILNYNGCSLFKSIFARSVDSALSIAYDNLDVVVIDNGSTDGSVDFLEEKFGKDVTTIVFDKNYGYAGGNEFGFREYVKLRGFVPDYVIFMNNDFIVTNPDAVKEAVKFMERREDVALAQGINLLPGGKFVDSAGGFIDVFLNVILRCGGLRLDECPNDSSYVSYVSGAFLIVKPAKVLSVRNHIFNPRLFSYWDETELALCMWSYGYKSIALPVVIGIHALSLSFKKFKLLSYYLFNRNRCMIRGLLRKDVKAMVLFGALGDVLSMTYMPFLKSGRLGFIWTRALVDGLRKRLDCCMGPYRPLMIAPKDLKTYIVNAMPVVVRRRMLRSFNYFERIRTFTVDEECLRSSFRPFLAFV